MKTLFTLVLWLSSAFAQAQQPIPPGGLTICGGIRSRRFFPKNTKTMRGDYDE